MKSKLLFPFFIFLCLYTKAQNNEPTIKEYKKTSLENGEQQGLYNGVSIKDISAQFTDCSEKTIQRELNDLVIKGRIKKSGSKRWSRYLSIES